MAKDLSSARRGRRHVSRDYTSKLRSDINLREAKRGARMSTAGMIGSFASGVAEYASALEKNVKSWEDLEKGAEKIYKEGKADAQIKLRQAKEAGDTVEIGKWESKIKEFGDKFDRERLFVDPDDPTKQISKLDKMFKGAPVGEVMRIGERGFFGEELMKVGKMKGASSNLLRHTTKEGNTLNLYETIGGKLYGRDPDLDPSGKAWASLGNYWVADESSIGGSIFQSLGPAYQDLTTDLYK